VLLASAFIKRLCKHTKSGCHGDDVKCPASFSFFSVCQLEFTITRTLIKPGNLRRISKAFWFPTQAFLF